MISITPTQGFSMPELKSANENEISRHIETTSNEAASTMFISCKSYKRNSDIKVSHTTSLDLGSKLSHIPLFPGRKCLKSKMNQKRFEHKKTSNRKLPPLLDAPGTSWKNKFSSSKLSRRKSLVQRTHSPIFFNVSTPTPVFVLRWFRLISWCFSVGGIEIIVWPMPCLTNDLVWPQWVTWFGRTAIFLAFRAMNTYCGQGFYCARRLSTT